MAWKVVDRQVSKENSKKGSASEVVIEKKISDDSNENVSVITKMRSPDVVLKSERIRNNGYSNVCTWKIRMLEFTCLITMCIVILATFFLSIRIYSMLNELVLLE